MASASVSMYSAKREKYLYLCTWILYAISWRRKNYGIYREQVSSSWLWSKFNSMLRVYISTYLYIYICALLILSFLALVSQPNATKYFEDKGASKSVQRRGRCDENDSSDLLRPFSFSDPIPSDSFLSSSFLPKDTRHRPKWFHLAMFLHFPSQNSIGSLCLIFWQRNGKTWPDTKSEYYSSLSVWKSLWEWKHNLLLQTFQSFFTKNPSPFHFNRISVQKVSTFIDVLLIV